MANNEILNKLFSRIFIKLRYLTRYYYIFIFKTSLRNSCSPHNKILKCFLGVLLLVISDDLGSCTISKTSLLMQNGEKMTKLTWKILRCSQFHKKDCSQQYPLTKVSSDKGLFNNYVTHRGLLGLCVFGDVTWRKTRRVSDNWWIAITSW